MTKQKIEMLSHTSITTQANKQTSKQANKQANAMNFYSKTLSERYIHIPSSVGRNANGKRVLEPGSTSEEQAYRRSLRRFVDTTEYSIDVLAGKMARLSLEDKREPEEVIVWKGNYIVCD